MIISRKNQIIFYRLGSFLLLPGLLIFMFAAPLVLAQEDTLQPGVTLATPVPVTVPASATPYTASTAGSNSQARPASSYSSGSPPVTSPPTANHRLLWVILVGVVIAASASSTRRFLRRIRVTSKARRMDNSSSFPEF